MLETNYIEWHGVAGSRCYIFSKIRRDCKLNSKNFHLTKIFSTIIRIKKNIAIFSLSLVLGFWLLKFTDVDFFQSS